jgi:hypothetical protein
METSVWLEIQSGLDLPHHHDLFLAVPACAAKQRELIGVGTGREQAEIFMRQQAKRDRGGSGTASNESHYPNANKPRDADHSNSNKTADHGERIFADSQHMAPHRDIAPVTGL